MNNAVNTVTPADISAAVKRQPKAQSPDDGKFKSMLSGAVDESAGAGGAVRQQRAEAKTGEKPGAAGERPARAEPQKQTAPKEKARGDRPEEDDADAGEYGRQALPEVMQVMLPMAVPVLDMPQTEIPSEINTAAAETADFTPIQAMASGTAEQAGTETAAGYTVRTGQDIPGRTVKDNEGTSAKPQEAFGVQAEPTEVLADRVRAQAAGTETRAAGTRPLEQTVQAAPETDNTGRTEPRIQEQRQTGGHEDPGLSREITSDITDTQVIRHPQRSVQMHNMRHARGADAAQSRFGEMVSKASQELNKSTAAAEPQQEAAIPGEALARGQEAVPATEQGKAAGQAETFEAEIKTEQETKPAEGGPVQKSVKVPVTEQRLQKEISKSDEAALGMIQQKPQTFTHEVIRAEPVPQPGQAQMPDQAEQIKARVITSLENEKTEFQMQLHPEELGRINVKMILEGGKLAVEIAAANPKSAEMLSKQAESLIASLKAGDIDVTSVNVITASENASGYMNSEYGLNNFQNQFQNQANEHGQGGRGDGASRGHTAASEQAERERIHEKLEAPQRILNYSV